MPDRLTGRDRLHGRNNGVRVDAIVPVELRDGAGLAEMLDPERPHPVAADRSEPGQGRRMAVEHGDNAAMGRQLGEQPLDVRAGVNEAALARAHRRSPARVEPVRRGHGEQPHVAAILGDKARRLDRLRRDRARIGNNHLAIRARLAQPIGAINDGLV